MENLRVLNRLLLPAVVSVLLSLIFILLTDIAGSWYVAFPAYRLQTDAFFHGHLQLHENVSRLLLIHDLAWGNGIQQVWGLGIPFIQMIFEIPSRVFGDGFFPDRLTFILFYAFCTIIFFTGIRAVFDKFYNPLWSAFWTTLITSWFFLQPIMIAMLGTIFIVYQEAIAYMTLWVMMLLGLLLHLLNKPKTSRFLTIVLLAGFIPLIRPSGIAYTVAISLCALIIFWQKNCLTWRSFLASGVCLLIFPLLLLLTNDLRFGHPLSFGHAQNLVGLGSLDVVRSLAFSNAFFNESITAALRELLGALFFLKNRIPDAMPLSLYKPDLNSWQALTPRLREFSFYTYPSLYLILLLGGWLGIIFSQKLKNQTTHLPLLYKVAGIFSFTVTVLLVVFYLYTPAISSRYLVDFYPAIVTGVTIGIVFIFILLQHAVPLHFSKIATICLTIIVCGWWAINVTKAATTNLEVYKKEMKSITDRASVVQFIEQYRRPAPPSILPEVITCPSSSTPEVVKNQIFFWGWNIANNSPICEVGIMTQLFLPDFECLSLDLAPSSQPLYFLRPYNTNWIQVKKDNTLLQQVAIPTNTNKNKVKITSEVMFCDPEPSTVDKKAVLVRINWIPDELYTPDNLAISYQSLDTKRIGIELRKVTALKNKPPE